MENEIVSGLNSLTGLADLGTSKYADDKSFGIVASSANFLPRIMLMGANSTQVKEGKINMGRYAFIRSKDQLDDLTPECPVLVLGWRPKAMQFHKDDTVTSIYNPKSEEFSRISVKADSDESDTGCMFGPEFLVWVTSVGAFATFFMSSKTARREAPQLKALMGKAALLKCQLIKAGKFVWHGPVVTMYSQPVTNIPTMDEITEQVTKFNNPPETKSEQAPEENRAR